MKKLLFLSVLSLMFANAKSQEVSFGMRAGISKSSMAENFADFANTSSITGFTGGLYVKAKFLGFFVMPEVNYNQRGGEIGNIGTNKIHYIDVPVLAGKQFFKLVRINAGPVFQFAVASEKISNSGTYTNNSEINNFVLGLQAGAGVDIWKLSFDVRYDTGITDAAKIVMNNASASTSDLNYSSRSSMWLFTVGYRFIKL